MNILYVTSEANPFAASGGLGDVMGAFPPALADIDEYKCSVLMPLYDTVKDEYRHSMVHVADLSFNLSWRKSGASLYKITRSKTNYYFIENHYYFDRGRLYGEDDDIERFAFLSRAAVEILSKGYIDADIVHCNDWQTAACVVYLKTEFSMEERLRDLKTVFTIHNIEYQGKFDPYLIGDIFGIDEKYRSILEFNGCANLMKGAIVCSDFVTTVSPNYRNELEYDFFAFGLENIIRAARDKTEGVINGIDYSYFSPKVGKELCKNYDVNSYKQGKSANKKELCSDLGLSTDPELPLIVMITRLTSGKGVDLVLGVIREIMQLPLQMVILGTGDEHYEIAFKESEKYYPNLRALIKFDRELSKRMYASADIFLMPSKSEPCGLAQMIACSYGALPIVRSVGGLKDSIIPYGEAGANGFRFDNFNAHEMLREIEKAVSLYKNSEQWATLVKSAMTSDFTWARSAQKYASIYKKLNDRIPD